MRQPRAFWTRWRVRAGYALAAVLFLLAKPAPVWLGFGAAIAAAGLAIRAAAAGHLKKYERLATRGPYAWTRNPLYFGSALMAAGFALAAHSVIAAALLAAYFLTFYPAVMRREEAELRLRYGPSFISYAARVPLFWPRWPRPCRAVGEGSEVAAPEESAGTRAGNRAAAESDCAGRYAFSWERYRRNREYQAALGTLISLLLLWMRMHWAWHESWNWPWR